MKKWIFVISPAVLLALFLVMYSSDRKRVAAREEQYKQAQQKKLDDKKQRDKEVSDKNRADQAAKDAEKAKEEKAKEDDKMAKEDADRKADLDATDVAKKNFATRTNEIKTIESQISGVQRQRDQLLKDILDLSKAVEQAKIDRRTAELDFEVRKAQLLSVLAQDPLMQMPPPSAGPAGPGRGGPGGGGAPGGGGRGQ